ncbi:hypothetical protein [Xenorhabdus szentirmaii]|uniref:hypothetical protein n=1 Tax=Xenorhabdus szentirmaii TaxID=290112 RepID=UPI002B402844|nr:MULTISPECIES: hypothetical protein [unclassified Xenorhabdus]
MDYKYLLSIKTSKSFCYLSVNGIAAMDNSGAGTHGVQSSGLNATFTAVSINSYFNASAQISAKVLVALESIDNSMELVLYHEGIQASVNIKYGVSIKPEKDDDEWEVPIGNEDEPIEKDWIFQKPLPKEKSTYRISLG